MSLILHHYPLSPFSEKIRAMLGYTGTTWSSCFTSEAPPRGKLDLLSGGYNRIPVAQIGSDIFCDTNLIADEIAKTVKKPALANSKLSAEELELRLWLESKLFFACVNRAFNLGLVKRIAQEKGFLNLGLFLKDRILMAKSATISMGNPKSAPKYIAEGITKITQAMGQNDFVGGKQPNLIDFSAYHCFWFLSYVGQRSDLESNPQIFSWYSKMQDFTSRPAKNISIEQALKAAKNSEPRKIGKKLGSDLRIGSKVTISPSDYRQVEVTGTLVGCDEHRWIISRKSPETGTIHLHFPTHAVNVNIRLNND